MTVYDCDVYWLTTVAGVEATTEDIRKMDEAANDMRAYINAATERRATSPRRPYQPSDCEVIETLRRDRLLSRSECEARSRAADLIVYRPSENLFIVRVLSDAARIAFESYLPGHRHPASAVEYKFKLHEVEAIGRLAAQFNLKVATAGGGE